MRARIDWAKIAGLALHILIGGLLILTGSQKIFGSAPPEALVKFGLGEQARLIGAGAIITALLLLVPRTASLGLLLTSAFWGGAICIHMAHRDPYVFQSIMLVLTWVGAYRRSPATPTIFSSRPRNDVGVARTVASVQALTGPPVERESILVHRENGAGI